MLALVTGASSGIGLAIARYLASLRYDLILTARDAGRLERAGKELAAAGVSVRTARYDLADRKACVSLHDEMKDLPVDFLVNCAGLGVYGPFAETDLEKELRMIDVNVTAVHILTKLFLRDMMGRGRGVILNVGSSAGFMAGPLFAGYYASKNYVVRLTEAIHEELRRAGSPVKISVLCPGPVDTPFNRTAGIDRPLPGQAAALAAKRGIDGALAGQMLVVPGAMMKLGVVLSRFPGDRLMTRITYRIQSTKGGRGHAETG